MINNSKVDIPQENPYSYKQVNISASEISEGKKLRCAIYGRVSTTYDSQKNSLENQRDLLINYANQRGYTIVEFYEEHASGTKKTKRKELQRMLDDMENKKFDIILVKELSRLARNVRLAYDILDLTKYNDILIDSLDNTVGNKENSEFLFTLYAALYQQETQNTSNRVCASKQTKATKGYYIGSLPPYGYSLEEGKLYIRNDNTPDVVRFIFRAFLSGKGQDAIAGILNQKSLPTPGQVIGRVDASEIWRGTTVKKILRNFHYTGNLGQRRTKSLSIRDDKRINVDKNDWVYAYNTHQAIINTDEYELVQQLIEQKNA